MAAHYSGALKAESLLCIETLLTIWLHNFFFSVLPSSHEPLAEMCIVFCSFSGLAASSCLCLIHGWVKCRNANRMVVNWQCYSFTEVVLQSSIIIYSNSYSLLNAYCASGTTLSTHTYVHIPSTPHYLNDHSLSKARGEAVFCRCVDWALVRFKSQRLKVVERVFKSRPA